MATLKISDLSVGDWVYYDKGNTPYSIRGIYHTGRQDCVVLNDEKYSDGVIAFVDKLTPIPITADILEQNGFEDMGSGLMRYEFELREKKYKIILGSLDEGVWFADFYFMRKKNIDSNIPLFYIHQLQHILRLAGVDKEINL